ncbi:hypothetical protein, partial [Enterovirga sp. CN4-39]|uniref:hypothetical protein n=1 Tax=Enterovirga sp. CN4-39 TaxID=3400910 RepID=UPI003BFE358E
MTSREIPFRIGESVLRREDLRFVTGRGRYVADQKAEGELHAVFVRSPHAHAKILRIDAGRSRGMAG